MVRVGDKVKRTTLFGIDINAGPHSKAKERYIDMVGTVIYVNRAHWFHVVEFELPPKGYKIRESYKGL